MKRLVPLVLLFFAACSMTVTEQERRWKAIEGDDVFIETGYGTTIHEQEKCPKLAEAKGPVKKGRIKGGRVMDDQGMFVGGPGHKPDLCPTCVR